MKWKTLVKIAEENGVKLTLPQLEIQDTVRTLCCWSDVLGFGTKCVEYDWDLVRMYEAGLFVGFQWLWKRSREAVRPYSAEDGSSFEEYIQGLNDGLVRGIDLPSDPNPLPWTVFHYFHHLVSQHYIFSDLVEDLGFPGVITIIATGERLRFKDERGKKAHGESMLLPVAFNMNTAFAYAYVLESKGKEWAASPKSVYVTGEAIKYLESISADRCAVEDKGSGRRRYLDYGHELGGSPVYGVSLAFAEELIPVKTGLFQTNLYTLMYSNEWNELTGEHHIKIQDT